MTSQRRNFGCWNNFITLKFDRCLGSNAAKAPVKFHNDWAMPYPYLKASRFQELPCGKMSYRLVNGGPGFFFFFPLGWKAVIDTIHHMQYMQRIILAVYTNWLCFVVFWFSLLQVEFTLTYWGRGKMADFSQTIFPKHIFFDEDVKDLIQI